MDLLVVGSNGLLGSNVAARASARPGSIVAAYHTTAPDLDVETVELDVTDDERAATYPETRPVGRRAPKRPLGF